MTGPPDAKPPPPEAALPLERSKKTEEGEDGQEKKRKKDKKKKKKKNKKKGSDHSASCSSLSMMDSCSSIESIESLASDGEGVDPEAGGADDSRPEQKKKTRRGHKKSDFVAALLREGAEEEAGKNPPPAPSSTQLSSVDNSVSASASAVRQFAPARTASFEDGDERRRFAQTRAKSSRSFDGSTGAGSTTSVGSDRRSGTAGLRSKSSRSFDGSNDGGILGAPVPPSDQLERASELEVPVGAVRVTGPAARFARDDDDDDSTESDSDLSIRSGKRRENAANTKGDDGDIVVRGAVAPDDLATSFANIDANVEAEVVDEEALRQEINTAVRESVQKEMDEMRSHMMAQSMSADQQHSPNIVVAEIVHKNMSTTSHHHNNYCCTPPCCGDDKKMRRRWIIGLLALILLIVAVVVGVVVGTSKGGEDSGADSSSDSTGTFDATEAPSTAPGDASSSTSAPTWVDPTILASGYFGGHYYEHYFRPRTWEDASNGASTLSFCDKQGHLVSISSYDENQFVASLNPYVSAIWMGLNDLQEEGSFVWDSGETFDSNSFTNWESSGPNGGPSENCGEVYSLNGATGIWNDLSCEELREFVVEYDCEGGPEPVPAPLPEPIAEPVAEPVAVAEPVPVLSGNAVPAWISGFFEGRYYALHDSMTWDDAQTFAESQFFCGQAGHLVTLTSPEEEVFVRNTLMPSGSSNAFIGLNDIASEGVFVWDNGDPTVYLNWSAGEPNGGSLENCVELSYAGNGWNDIPCGESRLVIVEYDCDVEPTRSGDLSGHHYQYFNLSMSWFNARDFAESISYCNRPGYLTSINSNEENTFVLDSIVPEITSYPQYLIGLNDNDIEGSYAWADGQPLGSYSNWAVIDSMNPEPNGGTVDNCVEAIADMFGAWNDVRCDDEWMRPFVVEYDCQEDAVLVPTTCDPALTTTSWNQLGSNIEYTGSSGWFGYQLSMSGDGQRLAISATNNYGGDFTTDGKAGLYQWDSIFQDWTGVLEVEEGVGVDPSPHVAAISGDGTVFAVSSWTRDVVGVDSGLVAVYKFDISAQVAPAQMGTSLTELSGEQLGYYLSLSRDGTVLAASTRGNSVRIYRWDTTSDPTNPRWVQTAYLFDDSGAPFADAVTLSADGNTLVVSGNDLLVGGRARIYRWDEFSNAWFLSETIVSDPSVPANGQIAALSEDGTIVAVGFYNDGAIGYVQIMSWDEGTSSWTQLGSTIYGDVVGDSFAHAVSLNAAGTVCAIGSIRSSPSGMPLAGLVRVFEFNGSDWCQVGPDIVGQAANDYLGASVSLSSDGSLVAAGAIKLGSPGSVRVYRRES